MYWICFLTQAGQDYMWDTHWVISPAIFTAGIKDQRALMFCTRWASTVLDCRQNNMLWKPASILQLQQKKILPPLNRNWIKLVFVMIGTGK